MRNCDSRKRELISYLKISKKIDFSGFQVLITFLLMGVRKIDPLTSNHSIFLLRSVQGMPYSEISPNFINLKRLYGVWNALRALIPLHPYRDDAIY